MSISYLTRRIEATKGHQPGNDGKPPVLFRRQPQPVFSVTRRDVDMEMSPRRVRHTRRPMSGRPGKVGAPGESGSSATRPSTAGSRPRTARPRSAHPHMRRERERDGERDVREERASGSLTDRSTADNERRAPIRPRTAAVASDSHVKQGVTGSAAPFERVMTSDAYGALVQ
ncbi:hypothetical protein KIPB_012988, partial [Kipferlia bialata]|eukprot:g12988.t1